MTKREVLNLSIDEFALWAAYVNLHHSRQFDLAKLGALKGLR